MDRTLVILLMFAFTFDNSEVIQWTGPRQPFLDRIEQCSAYIQIAKSVKEILKLVLTYIFSIRDEGCFFSI